MTDQATQHPPDGASLASRPVAGLAEEQDAFELLQFTWAMAAGAEKALVSVDVPLLRKALDQHTAELARLRDIEARWTVLIDEERHRTTLMTLANDDKRQQLRRRDELVGELVEAFDRIVALLAHAREEAS